VSAQFSREGKEQKEREKREGKNRTYPTANIKIHAALCHDPAGQRYRSRHSVSAWSIESGSPGITPQSSAGGPEYTVKTYSPEKTAKPVMANSTTA